MARRRQRPTTCRRTGGGAGAGGCASRSGRCTAVHPRSTCIHPHRSRNSSSSSSSSSSTTTTPPANITSHRCHRAGGRRRRRNTTTSITCSNNTTMRRKATGSLRRGTAGTLCRRRFRRHFRIGRRPVGTTAGGGRGVGPSTPLTEATSCTRPHLRPTGRHPRRAITRRSRRRRPSSRRKWLGSGRGCRRLPRLPRAATREVTARATTVDGRGIVLTHCLITHSCSYTSKETVLASRVSRSTRTASPVAANFGRATSRVSPLPSSCLRRAVPNAG